MDVTLQTSAGPVPARGTPEGTVFVHVKDDDTARNRKFKPSDYVTALTMNGTAQVITLATGVALGLGTVDIYNKGPTTAAIKVAFGISSADAQANLGLTGVAPNVYASTGQYEIPTFADAGTLCREQLSVPALATHMAVANAAAGTTAPVSVAQGV